MAVGRPSQLRGPARPRGRALTLCLRVPETRSWRLTGENVSHFDRGHSGRVSRGASYPVVWVPRPVRGG